MTYAQDVHLSHTRRWNYEDLKRKAIENVRKAYESCGVPYPPNVYSFAIRWFPRPIKIKEG